jgi:hypothetical protein
LARAGIIRMKTSARFDPQISPVNADRQVFHRQLSANSGKKQNGFANQTIPARRRRIAECRRMV